MAAPIKPWERSGAQFHTSPSDNAFNSAMSRFVAVTKLIYSYRHIVLSYFYTLGVSNSHLFEIRVGVVQLNLC